MGHSLLTPILDYKLPLFRIVWRLEQKSVFYLCNPFEHKAFKEKSVTVKHNLNSLFW